MKRDGKKVTLFIGEEVDTSVSAVYGVGLQPFACWDWGFASRQCIDICLFECWVLSGSGLGVGLIIRPEES